MSPNDPTAAAGDTFKVCSTCKKPIRFEAPYYRCSVSTCNRARLALYFCSVPCWDAHVPEARHRDAWAEPTHAPTRAAWEAEQRAEAAAEQAQQDKTPRDRRIVQSGQSGTTGAKPNQPTEIKRESELPHEVLVVVSKLKAYVKAASGFNTSDGVVDVLSDHLRRLCDLAIENAANDSRKTVLDRDFKPLIKAGQ